MPKRATKLARKARKSGLSLVKMASIQRNKMAKQGILSKENRKKKKKQKQIEKRKTYHQLKQQKKEEAERLRTALEDVHPLSREMSGEDFLEMLDEEELKNILDNDSSRKRKKKGVEGGEGKKDTDDIEEHYEQTERNFVTDGQPPGKKMRKLLPIKKDLNIIERTIEMEDKAEDSDSGVHEDEDEDEEDHENDDLQKEKMIELPVKSTVDILVERRQKLNDQKIKIGCLASNVIEDPHTRIGNLTGLNRILKNPDVDVVFTIQKYSALSLLEVFHNLIPSYRVCTHDVKQKLKKETRILYMYENELLHQYKQFLLGLENILDEFKNNQRNELLMQVAVIAVRCMGELLIQHPHFNYTTNIIQAIVPYLKNSCNDLRNLAVDFICKAFKNDKEGHLSVEIVRKIDKLIRKSAFRVHPDCFKVFLSLRIKHMQNSDSNREIIQNVKQKKTRNEKMIQKMAEKHKLKPSKQQAKEKRKMAKLNAEIKIVMADKEAAQHSQQDTEVIQIVFALYIHVLKRRPNKKLVGIVLEGLAKFAHLVNIEFFSDLLEVLAILLEGSDDLAFKLTHRESLHCIQTVFTILSGQGEVLNIDPHRFSVYLYSKMLDINAASQHLNIITTLESCNQLLLKRRNKVSSGIVNAFTKRLATLALSLLHHGIIPTLAAVRSIVLAHNCTEALLDPNPEGTSGSFISDAEDPLHCNAAASALWELHLLSRHYHVNVSQLSHHLLKGAPIQGAGSIPFSLTKKSAEELYEHFDSTEMKLNPHLPHPDHHLKTKKRPHKELKQKPMDDIEDWFHTLSDENKEKLRSGTDNLDVDYYSSMEQNIDFSLLSGISNCKLDEINIAKELLNFK